MIAWKDRSPILGTDSSTPRIGNTFFGLAYSKIVRFYYFEVRYIKSAISRSMIDQGVSILIESWAKALFRHRSRFVICFK